MKGLSIVVTYYKGEEFIYKCLDSIFGSYAFSNQSLAYEVVLIIDSIEDAHVANDLAKTYAAKPLIILKNDVNIGVSESRNRALKHINYQFYSIIDQDDYVTERYFPVLEQELSTDLAIHILNAKIENVKANILTTIYTFKPRISFEGILLKKTFIYTPGLLIFNSQFIPAENLFIDTSEEYKGCDDWAAYLNLCIDLKDKVTQKFIPEVLFVYCLHATNFSNNVSTMISSSIAVLNFLKNKVGVSSSQLKLIEYSLKMHKFYKNKDIVMMNKGLLFLKSPKSFLYHYFFSFFNLERLNRLVFKARYQLKLRTKSV